MALFDHVDMCMSCGKSFEKTRFCPECDEKLTRVDPRAFQALVTLRGKGYRPVKVASRGISKDKTIVVFFEGYSPGMGVHGEMQIGFEDGMATCATKPWGKGIWEKLAEWTLEASFAAYRVPFDRGLCKLCDEQDDAKWLNGVCRCPQGMLVMDREFHEGLPEKCLYLVEQTMTRESIEEKFLEEVS